MSTTKIEFAVEMTCQKCVNAVQSSLSGLDGIKQVDISLEKGTVMVDTELPCSLIQEKIESSGRRAVLKGYGDNTTSAVSMLGGDSGYSVGDSIKGVIRFVQSFDGCIIDGAVDGLSPGPHGLHVHECGDISRGCESVGEHYNPHNTVHGGPDDNLSRHVNITEKSGIINFVAKKIHVGDLGNIVADNSGRATFKLKKNFLNVPDIIGRSLVITEKPDDLGKGDTEASKINGNSGNRLACGIIARSSGIFQNTKKICACDGLTLWDERDKALMKKPNDSTNNL